MEDEKHATLRVKGMGLTSPHDGSALNTVSCIQGKVAVQIIQLSKIVAVIVVEGIGLEQIGSGGVLQLRSGHQSVCQTYTANLGSTNGQAHAALDAGIFAENSPDDAAGIR